MKTINITQSEAKVINLLKKIDILTWSMIRDLGVEYDIINLEEKGIIVGLDSGIFYLKN